MSTGDRASPEERGQPRMIVRPAAAARQEERPPPAFNHGTARSDTAQRTYITGLHQSSHVHSATDTPTPPSGMLPTGAVTVQYDERPDAYFKTVRLIIEGRPDDGQRHVFIRDVLWGRWRPGRDDDESSAAVRIPKRPPGLQEGTAVAVETTEPALAA